uniref:Akirin-2 n=1 Tax=Sarcophilus harrisii TaxID=9305 RepID=A0A7N4PGZ6_SARHA
MCAIVGTRLGRRLPVVLCSRHRRLLLGRRRLTAEIPPDGAVPLRRGLFSPYYRWVPSLRARERVGGGKDPSFLLPSYAANIGRLPCAESDFGTGYRLANCAGPQGASIPLGGRRGESARKDGFGWEQILYNIKQEYKRMQKRRHLETSFQQTDACCSSDSQPHAFLLNGPASPGTSSAASSPLKKEQPLFTLRQVGMICERLLKEREEKVREEYEEILTTKLAEQYDAFVKFTHDQIMRRYGEQPASYVS